MSVNGVSKIINIKCVILFVPTWYFKKKKKKRILQFWKVQSKAVRLVPVCRVTVSHFLLWSSSSRIPAAGLIMERLVHFITDCNVPFS